jgi:hypothetical protein
MGGVRFFDSRIGSPGLRASQRGRRPRFLRSADRHAAQGAAGHGRRPNRVARRVDGRDIDRLASAVGFLTDAC